MGIVWDKPKIVKNNTLFLMVGALPASNSEKLWELYKNKKMELKTDGFGIGKDEKTGRWDIKYFSDTNGKLTRNIQGETLAEVEFKQKLNKWIEIFKTVKVVNKEVVKDKNNKPTNKNASIKAKVNTTNITSDIDSENDLDDMRNLVISDQRKDEYDEEEVCSEIPDDE